MESGSVLPRTCGAFEQLVTRHLGCLVLAPNGEFRYVSPEGMDSVACDKICPGGRGKKLRVMRGSLVASGNDFKRTGSVSVYKQNSRGIKRRSLF